MQHLRNELAVRIYEAHARSALEYGDIGEYNQCQTQLIAFYADGLPGCREEFLAYRILYQTVHVGQGEGAALLGTLQAVSPEVRPTCVPHDTSALYLLTLLLLLT